MPVYTLTFAKHKQIIGKLAGMTRCEKEFTIYPLKEAPGIDDN